MKKALVTGGAGFIGSHLVDYLLKEGWHVRVLDNLSSGSLSNLEHHKGNANLEIVIGDLKLTEVALRAVNGMETVFHFAANPEVRLSTTHPKIHFDENIVATFNLLEAIRQAGNVKHLVFASSSSVYGEPETIPVDESTPIKPVSVYGASKAACENLIHAYSVLYGIRSVVLRYANVVGPRLRHGVLFDLIMKLKRNPSELEILGDGGQVRSYIHVDDAIKATMTALNNVGKHFEVYNVGNEDWITVREVAEIICEVIGVKPRFIFKPVLHGIGWPGDVKKIALKITKIKSLGWKPMLSSVEAVKAAASSLVKSLYLLA